jgi:hypothetical protein
MALILLPTSIRCGSRREPTLRNLKSLKRAQPIALLVVLGSYTRSVQLPSKSLTSVVIEDLTPARWYFAVKAYNSSGVESVLPGSVNKHGVEIGPVATKALPSELNAIFTTPPFRSTYGLPLWVRRTQWYRRSLSL